VELILLYLCTIWLTNILFRVSATAILEMFEVMKMFNIIFFTNLFVGPEISTLSQLNEVQSLTFYYSKTSFNSKDELIL
jgi:hypothetical protein